MTAEETKMLEELLAKFEQYENDCWDKIGFLNEHKFAFEKQAVDLKRQAYHDCYRELRRTIGRLST